jgi:hypothetical protein
MSSDTAVDVVCCTGEAASQHAVASQHRIMLVVLRQRCYFQHATPARNRRRGIFQQPNSFQCRGCLGIMMYNREFAPVVFVDFRELLEDVWTDFTATSPVGIDLIAEASLRSMIAARLMRAANAGETDRA